MIEINGKTIDDIQWKRLNPWKNSMSDWFKDKHKGVYTNADVEARYEGDNSIVTVFPRNSIFAFFKEGHYSIRNEEINTDPICQKLGIHYQP